MATKYHACMAVYILYINRKEGYKTSLIYLYYKTYKKTLIIHDLIATVTISFCILYMYAWKISTRLILISTDFGSLNNVYIHFVKNLIRFQQSLFQLFKTCTVGAVWDLESVGQNVNMWIYTILINVVVTALALAVLSERIDKYTACPYSLPLARQLPRFFTLRRPDET